MIKTFFLFTFLCFKLLALDIKEIKLEQKLKGDKVAIKLYKKLIKEENNSQAKIELAKLYINSKEIKPSIKKAYYLLKDVSSQSPYGMYLLAKVHFSKKSPYFNKIKAYNYFVDASNMNYNKAHTMLAKHFLFGITIEKDYEKAMFYFKKASKQKDYSANCYIAYMYASGFGVLRNFGRAHVFAKDQYKKGNKLCKKIWKDYNLGRYKEDRSWKIGDYTSPVK